MRTQAHRFWARAALIPLALGASVAVAQDGNAQPAPAQQDPAQPAPVMSERDPRMWPDHEFATGPYLARTRSRDWLVRLRVQLQSYQSRGLTRIENQRVSEPLTVFEVWELDQFSVHWSVLRRSGSHLLLPRQADVRFGIERVDLPVPCDMLPGPGLLANTSPGPAPAAMFHSGAIVIEREGLEGTTRGFRIEMKVPVRAWDTVYHEAAANEVAWPEGDWPLMAQATFGPQSFVDVDASGTALDMTAVTELVDRWLDGRDPREASPAMLAKYLAGRVQDFFRLQQVGIETGGSVRADIPGIADRGLRVQPVPLSVERGLGTNFDMVMLLTAVYRAAGIPARTIFAARDSDEDEEEIRGNGLERVYSWVEWCLYDEPNGTVNWIPVDIVEMERSSSRSRPFNQPWEFFGTHDRLRDYPVFTAHIVPPTPVVGFGSPAFWGWSIESGMPEVAFQWVNIGADRLAVYPGPSALDEAAAHEARVQEWNLRRAAAARAAP